MFIPPVDVNLLITRSCNLRCRHCAVRMPAGGGFEMDIEGIRKVLDELQRNRVLRLVVTGGEPLNRPDFPLIWREIYSRPFRVSLNTNGTLLTEQNIELVLEAAPRLGTIMISLDGCDEATVDGLRGEGTFARVDAALKRLRARGARPGFYCVVSRLNHHRLESIADYASRYGNWIKFNPIVDSGPGVPRELLLEPSELAALAEELSALKARSDISIEGVLANIPKVIDGSEPGRWPSFACGAAKSRMAVFPDGTVSPCDYFPDIGLGNLLEQSLEDILTGPAAAAVRETVEHALEGVDECRDCSYRDRCPAGCPVYALLKNRDDIRDPQACPRLLLDE